MSLASPEWRVLQPFNANEAMPVKEAAARAGRSEGTVRNWCRDFGIGRKIGGEYYVSRVALEMFLAGDDAALAIYHSGERNSESVAPYFENIGLSH